MKLIKWILLVPVLLVVVGVIATEINKAYWDHKVRQWCEKDGGVTVYEKVELTQEEYERNDGNNGFIVPWPERTSKAEHDFYTKQFTEIFHSSNPVVKRLEFIAYRKSDGKELGKMVTYGRTGGDFPTGFAGTSFTCADMKNIALDVEKQIFTFKGE